MQPLLNSREMIIPIDVYEMAISSDKSEAASSSNVSQTIDCTSYHHIRL